MPKHGVLITGLVLLCLTAAAADQMLHGRVRTATHPLGVASASVLPVSYLGSAMVIGAQHRLDRPSLAPLAE